MLANFCRCKLALLKCCFIPPGNVKGEREVMRLCPDFSEANRLLFYSPGGNTVQLVDIANTRVAKMELPFAIR